MDLSIVVGVRENGGPVPLSERSDGWRSTLLEFLAFLPEGISLERDLVGVVHESVKDGVGARGVADDGVPFLDGDLLASSVERRS